MKAAQISFRPLSPPGAIWWSWLIRWRRSAGGLSAVRGRAAISAADSCCGGGCARVNPEQDRSNQTFREVIRCNLAELEEVAGLVLVIAQDVVNVIPQALAGVAPSVGFELHDVVGDRVV